MISPQRLRPLLKRAAMTIFQWNTNVTRSSDDTDRRINVSAPASNKWGDCVALFRFHDSYHARWEELIVLSPARARVLGEQLIEAAERREKLSGTKCIDKEVE